MRHEGRHFSISGVQVTNRRTEIPLILGGNTDRALRRAAQLGDGWFSSGTPPFEEALRLRDELTRLRREADEEGGVERPFELIFRVEGCDPAVLRRYADAGFDERVAVDRPGVAAGRAARSRAATPVRRRRVVRPVPGGGVIDVDDLPHGRRVEVAGRARRAAARRRRSALGRGLRRRQRVPRPHRRRGAGAARAGDDVAAREVRRRLRRHPVAGRVRRCRPAGDLRGGVRGGGGTLRHAGPPRDVQRHAAPRRPDDPRLRHRGAAARADPPLPAHHASCAASCSPSPAPGPTSPGWRPGPSATATSGWSTARRRGARARASRRGAS